MRNTYRVISVLVCCLLLCGVLGAVSVSASSLQVTFTTNPVVVGPGTSGYIEVNLKSVGGSVGTIDIEASSWDPNTIIPQGNWEVDVGSLDSGESYSVLFEFRVPSTANIGLGQVVFVITGSGGTIRQTAIIRIENTGVLDLAAVTPTSVRIGEATTLLFNITNNGGSTLSNILFTWADPNDLILPVGADNRITIASIAADNYTLLPVVVMASSGISPGIYPLTITLEYYDSAGTLQTVNSTVGLQISGTTTFDVVVQSSSTSSTSFAVINTGANTASSVVVSIPTQQGYSTSGTSSATLGNLEAGDYTLASFQLTSTSSNITGQFPMFNETGMGAPPSGRNFTGGPEMFTNRSFSGMSGNQLRIQIAYTDVFGVRQTVQKQVNLTSSSASGFSSRTTQGASGNFPGGFPGQSQSSDSNDSLLYIGIGAAGIIIVFAVIYLARKKKLSKVSKLLKGRKE